MGRMADENLLNSLRSALDAVPDDAVLRLHVAGLLLDGGLADEAVHHIAEVLQREPANAVAQALMRKALGGPDPAVAIDARASFDWSAAEEEVADVVQPAFVTSLSEESAPVIDLERPTVTLSDVGGLDDVKQRLELSFLGPMRQPELRKLYGKSLRGGLLLYGPPGCGKSFLAQAVAGELGLSWVSVQLHEVLDMWVGSSERNLHEVFQSARQASPCVVFIDELDAIGQRRTNMRNNAMRTTVNQLLAELDGTVASNEGVYVIAATNHPWDVDPALRRPGRFGHMVLVPPPDTGAREAIFRTHLRDRPVEGIDLRQAARQTAGFSGADIAQICESAAEQALADSLRTGQVRTIVMSDLEIAISASRPSTGPWFDAARNVVMFANEGGTYDALRGYMKMNHLL
jgi:SpoVK/Ycf46/Vps4 family AAA+-type ATPase